MSQELLGITGASGFIGTRLIEELKLKKIGYKRSLGREYKLKEFLDGITTVINLVGSFLPPFQEQVKTNVVFTNSLCEAMAKSGIKRIIHISAAAAYGSPKNDTLFTEKNDLIPDTQYGLAKKIGEDVLNYYGRTAGFSTIIFRPPNVYGPGSDHGAIFNLIKSIKETGRATVFGDGEQRRDFMNVADLVDVIIKAIDYKSDFEVFNVGSGKTYSLLEVIGMLEKISGKKVSKEFKEAQVFTAKFVASDISKAERLLDWKPKVTLEDGLREVFENYG